jgi:hypothetical protein
VCECLSSNGLHCVTFAEYDSSAAEDIARIFPVKDVSGLSCSFTFLGAPQNLPPVRSQQAGETPAAQRAASTAVAAPQSSTPAAATLPAKPKESRIKSGDYRAWDRFNVDAELAMLEAEEKRAAAAATKVQQGNADALEGKERRGGGSRRC